MIRLLREWWTGVEPAAKAAWVAALAACAALLVNAVVVFQNSRTIDTAEQALRLSMEPSLDVAFVVEPGSNRVDIQNTGHNSLTDIDVYSVAYGLSENKREVAYRNIPGGPVAASRSLEPGRAFSIAMSDVFWNPQKYEYRSLVIVFHREEDGRRFVRVEPFLAAVIDTNLVAFPLYQTGRTASSGPPAFMIDIISEIERTERVLFRDTEF